MKNLYKYGMLAVAALAFASCNKEVDNNQDITGTHVVTVRASKDFDTRTAIVEGEDQATYVWTEGDVEYFHIYENGKEAVSKSMTVDGDGLATFTVSFNNTTATSFEYTARFFKEESNNHNPLIVADQKPTLTSYDPTADVLIAEPESKNKPATVLQFALRRVATINKMLLKGLESGEKISSVELVSTDKNFSAHYQLSSDSFTGAGKKLTLDYSELSSATVAPDGTFAVYFVSAPVEDASFGVKVTTDRNVYERSLSSKLTLVAGQVKRFGIQLGDYGTPISSGTEYVLVEGMDDLCGGATYLIYGAGYVLGEQKTNNRAAVAVTAEDGKITIDNTIDAYPVVIEETAGGYTIKDIRNNGYLYNNNTGKNYLLNKSEVGEFTTWTINIDGGIASINNVDNTARGIMGFNPNNGSPLFAAYGTIPTGGTSELALYVDKTTCVELEEAGLAYSVESPIEVIWDNRDSFEKPTLTNPHSLTVTYSSSDPAVATVDENSGDITFVGNGTTTITASSAKTETYKSGRAEYQIIVTGAPAEKGSEENPYTVAEALDIIEDLESGTANRTEECYISGIISEVTSYNSTYHSLTYNITADGSASSDFITVYSGKGLNGADFSSTSDLTVGDQLVIKGCLMKYNTTPQIYQSSVIVSRIPAPYFTAEVTENTIAYTGGNSITLKVKANVAWTATIDNSASLKIGDATASASVSGTTDTNVTVIIPENANGATYTISFSTTSDKVSAPEDIEIEQTDNSVQTKTYTLVITGDDFAGTYYNGNPTEYTFTATATDNTTMPVVVTSINVMKQGGIQFKASGGNFYNTTDLGKITSITREVATGKNDVNVVNIGATENPSSDSGAGSGGFFKIQKTGNGAAVLSKITIVFEK